jgi:hypothetical protein
MYICIKYKFKKMFTIQELKDLKEFQNHKILFDGYHYRWYSKINNNWNLHSIKLFDNYNKPFSWIKFNISIWKKEYNKFVLEENKKHIRRIKKELKIQYKLHNIKRQAELSNINKVNEILKIKPDISNNEICDLLGLSRMQVHRLRSC